MKLEDRLLSIKERIREAQRQGDQAKGAMENILQTLQRDHKVKTVAQAQTKLKKTVDQIDKTEPVIEKRLGEIEEKLQEIDDAFAE